MLPATEMHRHETLLLTYRSGTVIRESASSTSHCNALHLNALCEKSCIVSPASYSAAVYELRTCNDWLSRVASSSDGLRVAVRSTVERSAAVSRPPDVHRISRAAVCDAPVRQGTGAAHGALLLLLLKCIAICGGGGSCDALVWVSMQWLSDETDKLALIFIITSILKTVSTRRTSSLR